MEVVVLQVFVSLALVGGALLLFAHASHQRDLDHADRLALAPLSEDAPSRTATLPLSATAPSVEPLR